MKKQKPEISKLSDFSDTLAELRKEKEAARANAPLSIPGWQSTQPVILSFQCWNGYSSSWTGIARDLAMLAEMFDKDDLVSQYIVQLESHGEWKSPEYFQFSETYKKWKTK